MLSVSRPPWPILTHRHHYHSTLTRVANMVLVSSSASVVTMNGVLCKLDHVSCRRRKVVTLPLSWSCSLLLGPSKSATYFLLVFRLSTSLRTTNRSSQFSILIGWTRSATLDFSDCVNSSCRTLSLLRGARVDSAFCILQTPLSHSPLRAPACADELAEDTSATTVRRKYHWRYQS